MSDLRFAVRGLVRRPVPAAVAVATLSLGLASVTALFAVIAAVLLRPIGDEDSRLVRVWKDDVARGGGLLFPISYPEYRVWEDEATSFDAIAAINYADGATGAVMIDGAPVTANIVRASAELLHVVGARPAYGRLIEAEDDVEGAELVAVVSHRFWRRVSGDPAFVGQRLSPPGETPITIVGVLQPDVAYPVDADIWLPLVPAYARDPARGGRGWRAAPGSRTTRPHHEAAANEWAYWDIATPRYFETMGIPIVSGRAFARTDTADAQRVAIVSESAAARYWPGEEPIGKRVRISPRFDWATVVGIAADLRYRELTNNWMTVYYPAAQSFHFAAGNLAIRTVRPPATLLPTVRETIQAMEPAVPIDTLAPMDELLGAELARPRLAVRLSAAFAVVTLVLITVGLFGTVSFDARQRRVEMAIRSALGASPHALRRLVAGRGLRMAAAGVVTGLVATALGARALGSVLFGVEPLDPLTLATVSGGLVLLAGLACWIPARRAASTDPSETLRSGEWS